MKKLSLTREKDKARFFLVKREGKYIIMKDEGWYITDATIGTDFVSVWWGIDTFDSMIKAYRFMKENLERFL